MQNAACSTAPRLRARARRGPDEVPKRHDGANGEYPSFPQPRSGVGVEVNRPSGNDRPSRADLAAKRPGDRGPVDHPVVRPSACGCERSRSHCDRARACTGLPTQPRSADRLIEVTHPFRPSSPFDSGVRSHGYEVVGSSGQARLHRVAQPSKIGGFGLRAGRGARHGHPHARRRASGHHVGHEYARDVRAVPAGADRVDLSASTSEPSGTARRTTRQPCRRCSAPLGRGRPSSCPPGGHSRTATSCW